MEISPPALADILGPAQVMDIGIRPLWSPVPRITGPAFTVRCPAGDHLMLHAAVHRADPGSVIVVESGDLTTALAGGNVCQVALRRQIAGFVLDGVIRDIGEVRAMGFPVFGRGVVPVAARKAAVLPLNVPVRCGGVAVTAGDVIVADEEGIVVVPSARAGEVLQEVTDAEEPPFEEWEAQHRARIDKLLDDAGWQSDQS
jgi:4-hydroxy-4-methyl-2-oxoglutarate aldolase